MIITELSRNIIELPRFVKRIIAIILDISLCVLCVASAFYLRLEKFIGITDATIVATLLSISLAIPIFWLLGLYKTMFRFAGLSIILNVLVASVVYALFYFIIISIDGGQNIPRSVGIIQPLLLFFAISSSRMFFRYIFINTFFLKRPKNKKKILIYGAGDAGRQLLSSLENNHEFKVVGFLDDNKQFHNQTILGQNVFDPSTINQLLIRKNIDLVLLALPSISPLNRNQIINNLNKYNIVVKTLPSIQDIVDGKISVSDIKDLTIEDLLSREQVKPNLELLNKNIKSKTVLVTGAGGSIGSELCAQIIKLNPKKLLLLELNEFALYSITEELKKLKPNLEIIAILANIQNSSRINELFKTFKVDTVYHAAAYKHVHLVEENICESVQNNVIGTFSLAQIAINNNVSNFVLISSDKAVRATNIMGASKRLAEICIQSLFDHSDKSTQFAIVRFGNVLQSSGSVIPKFKRQIKEGGPITLTHPDVTRYFMTLTEASQLVIQAGAMTDGCEVFVLDMGKSVKIRDLIYKMVKLSGLKVKDEENKDGDIEIKITGLRPGEKLYEELLLGDNPKKTFHEKIQKAQDPFISFEKLQIDLENLSNLIKSNKVIDVKNMLKKLVSSYQSNTIVVDNIYKEQSSLITPSRREVQKNNVIKINKK